MSLAAVPAIAWSILDSPVTKLPLRTGTNTSCTIFAHDLHRDIGIVAIVMETTVMVISLTCMCDAYCHVRHLTKQTLFASDSSGALSVARSCLAELTLPSVHNKYALDDWYTVNTREHKPSRRKEWTNKSPDVGHVNPTFPTPANEYPENPKAFRTSTSSNKTSITSDENNESKITIKTSSTMTLEHENERLRAILNKERESRDQGSTTRVLDYLSRDERLDTVQGSVLFAAAYDSSRLALILVCLTHLLDTVPYTVGG
jgi:hypothetical protein